MGDSIFQARARRSSPAIQTVRNVLATQPPDRIVLAGAPRNDVTPVAAPPPAPTANVEPRSDRNVEQRVDRRVDQRVDQCIDQRIAAILDEPPALGETIAVCFARKELALRALFGGLEVAVACALHKRVQIGNASDPLVIQLGRMTADRRQRLVNFLGDARRRAASSR